jgi:hypothetical protein
MHIIPPDTLEDMSLPCVAIWCGGTCTLLGLTWLLTALI